MTSATTRCYAMHGTGPAERSWHCREFGPPQSSAAVVAGERVLCKRDQCGTAKLCNSNNEYGEAAAGAHVPRGGEMKVLDMHMVEQVRTCRVRNLKTMAFRRG